MSEVVNKIRVSQHPAHRQAGTDYGRSFAATLPKEWAAQQISDGYEYVHCASKPGTRELVLTPLKAADVEQWRRETRRDRRNARAREGVA